MAKETIEPSQNQQGLADGKYQLQFTATEKFVSKDGKNLRKWAGVIRKVVESNIDPLTPNFEFVLPPFKYQELAIALGGVKQANGAVDWDDETVPGKIVELEIFHTEYKGKSYMDMKNIKFIGGEPTDPFCVSGLAMPDSAEPLKKHVDYLPIGLCKITREKEKNERI